MDPDRFSESGPVCAVATQQATFERCQRGFYPAPRSYGRTRESFEYMAFYQTAPVSAITHFARVENRVEQHRGEQGPMTDADWAATIDPFSEEDRVVVFEFEELIPLETPVENDQTGLRGVWYCTVEDLWESRTLSELANRAQT